jgi:hypothetical protein
MRNATLLLRRCTPLESEQGFFDSAAPVRRGCAQKDSLEIHFNGTATVITAP